VNNRYNKTQQIINNSDQYEDLLKQKGLNTLVQYKTFDFSKLKNIDKTSLDSILHKVEPFERLYMISQKYYGSPEYGWLICYMNRISSELDIKSGDSLIIYIPLRDIIGSI
jgi:hypothetical protein